MRDVHHRQPALAPQALDLVEDARLGDDVEAGRRLVEDDERRLADERDRDRHALLLAAGELVRVAAHELRVAGRWTRGERRGDGADLAVGSVLVEHVLDAPPMRSAGLSALPGSCGTYETSRPRSRRAVRSSRRLTVSPATSTSPPAIRTPGRA